MTTARSRFIPARAGNGQDGGSSPRVRGTEPFVAVRVASNRFIPARAGNGKQPADSRRSGSSPRVRGTEPAGSRPTSRGSSPRVRGTVFARDFTSIAGSSPRVRGTGSSVETARFIPARAGNGAPGARRHTSPVHPRACGERPERGHDYWRSSVHPRACGERASKETAISIGSSPRVRGTAEREGCACGERGFDGSSPRVRGTELNSSPRAGNGTASGFIPARAGNGIPIRRCRVARRSGSSPRVRGTGLIAHVGRSATDGSSPRVRGTGRIHPTLRSPALRFIPARAGNGTDTPRREWALRFIPARAGNGSFADEPESLMSSGSSPRVRGTVIGGGTRFLGGPVHPRACGERLISADP